MKEAPSSPALDLANVPEPMRSLLLKQLAKLPAPLREKLLREGSPMLDRLIAKAREQAHGLAPLPPSSAISDPDEDDAAPVRTTRARSDAPASASERVPTVMPGDSGSHFAWVLGSAVVLAAAVWYAFSG